MSTIKQRIDFNPARSFIKILRLACVTIVALVGLSNMAQAADYPELKPALNLAPNI